jgi:hypothetical protein
MAKTPKSQKRKQDRRAARIKKRLKGRNKTYEVTRFEGGQVREYAAPIDPALKDELDRQFRAFREKFGRDPGPGDPLFFDPDAPEPTPLSREQLVRNHLDLIAALEKVGASAAVVHAVKVTGLCIAEDAYSNVPDDRLTEWLAGLEEGEELHGDRSPCTCEPDLSDRALGL